MPYSEYQHKVQKELVRKKRIEHKDQNKILARMERSGVRPNCKNCGGDGECAIGNIHGVVGFRSGDNGHETCPICKGLGYKKQAKPKK